MRIPTWVAFGVLLAAGTAQARAPSPVPPKTMPKAAQKKLVLVILPEPASAGAVYRVDAAELRRLLSLFLSAYKVTVVLGPAMDDKSFPGQIRKARNIAARLNAIAVAWYRVIQAEAGQAELFLHLVDLVTDKALIRTLKLKGRTGPDLARAAALKVWSLLRASLLELGQAKRAKNPDLARLAGKPHRPRPEPRPAARPAPAAARPVRGPALRRKMRKPARVALGVGYEVGVFATGKGFHHGAEVSCDVTLKYFKPAALHLTLGLSAGVVRPVSEEVGAASIRLDLIPAAMRVLARWNRRSLTLQGGLRAGVLALRAEAFLASGRSQTFWKADPFLGADLMVGWRPVPRIGFYWQFRADGLLLGQCFVESSGRKMCVDRARFASGLGIQVTLP